MPAATTPRERFAELAAGADPSIDLALGALLIAAEADLERFLEIAPEDESAVTVRERLSTIRRQAPRLH